MPFKIKIVMVLVNEFFPKKSFRFHSNLFNGFNWSFVDDLLPKVLKFFKIIVILLYNSNPVESFILKEFANVSLEKKQKNSVMYELARRDAHSTKQDLS